MVTSALGSSKKILVRGTNWIGDAVMTTPALAALRSSCPHAEIVVLVNPLVAPLFQHHPAVDRVLIYAKKGQHCGIRGFFRMARELRRERFDAALLLQNAIEAALLTFAARIPLRAGYATDGRRLFLTDPVKVSSEDKKLHHTAYYLTLLERLGLCSKASIQSPAKLCLYLTEQERAWARATLGSDNVIALNPGAAYGSAKRWFPERFAAVADALVQCFGAKIVLTGGPAEREIGEDIASFMQHDCINMVGKTDVRQLMALLGVSRLLITNDSGPMHVAAALDVPIVAVFGPTDHTTTSPASARVRIVRKEVECAPCLLRQCPTDHRCMQSINAEDVIAAATELLKDIELLERADENTDS
ncbi:MAG: lipopolysaccharide heptosyltransferase II [Desulfuromonadaceae bacterium]|nr:lipopolysaccharide heptosyltransferase II [Desulfuromonadaceae bacterium]